MRTLDADGGGVSVITCMAGCNKAPGEVLQQHVIVVNPKPNQIRAASSAGAAYGESADSNIVTCVGGCYGAPTTYQAVPAPGFDAARAQVMAGAGGQATGQLVPTAAPAPGSAGAGKSKGASGDWMARINRERAAGN